MIESPHNPRLKAVRALHARKHREGEHCFLLETTKLVMEALQAGWPLDGIYATESWLERHAGIPAELVSDRAFQGLTTLESPEGVVAVARYPISEPLSVPPDAFFAMAVGLQDPGNLGTLIRTADAAGATAVLVCEGTVDPYAPKTVRATMGSLFHLPVQRTTLAEIIPFLHDRGVTILAAALGGTSLYAQDLTGKVAWMLGAEGMGLSEAQQSMADRRVEIPIPGKAESLNVAAASAVCLYETVRQRLI